jgi:hypothetical protein
MTRRLLAPTLAALLFLAACSSNTPSNSTAAPSPTSAAAAPTTSAAAATPTTCPNGRLPSGACAGGTSAVPQLMNDPVAPIVCPKIIKLQSTQDIYTDTTTMKAIGDEAARSRDTTLALAGQLLSDRAKLAVAAKGTDKEFSTTMEMGQAAIQLLTVCTKAGFK